MLRSITARRHLAQTRRRAAGELTRCPASIEFGLVAQDVADELAEVLLRVTGRGAAVDQYVGANLAKSLLRVAADLTQALLRVTGRRPTVDEQVRTDSAEALLGIAADLTQVPLQITADGSEVALQIAAEPADPLQR